MNATITAILHRCTQGALQGKLTFPEIVAQLTEIGVERYHSDYSRQEITYYFPDGNSLVVVASHPPHTTEDIFSPSGVASAVHQSQQNEHSYLDFIRKTMAAGCVGYFVQITGRSVLYFGRKGECHVEHFPPVPVL